MPYISPSQLKSGERYETIESLEGEQRYIQPAQRTKSRVRRQYDPNDINLAKLFPAIREHKTGNPPKDNLIEIQNLLNQPIQDINGKDANDHDNTLLHVAVSKGHEDIVDELLNQPGIDKSIKNRQDKTAFDLASDLDVSTYSNKQSIMAKLNPGPLVQAGSTGVSASLTPQLGDEVNYPSSGLKNSLHGNIYQLKLLMLFLKRGLSKKYDFRLSTEWDAAEKFDDLVFKYSDKNQIKYRFLQAKHKHNQSKKIKIGDLLTTDKDGEFNLEKYFISYFKIKNNPDLLNQDPILGNKTSNLIDLPNVIQEYSLDTSDVPLKKCVSLNLVDIDQEPIDGVSCSIPNTRINFFHDIPFATRPVPFEQPEDSFANCQPLEWYGRPSVVCKGKKTTAIVIPHLLPRIFDQVDGWLMLGQLTVAIANKFFSGPVTDTRYQLVDAFSADQALLWLEKLSAIRNQLKRLQSRGNTQNLKWIQYRLEDRQEEFEQFTKRNRVTWNEITEFTENLFALEEILDEMGEIPLQAPSSFQQSENDVLARAAGNENDQNLAQQPDVAAVVTTER